MPTHYIRVRDLTEALQHCDPDDKVRLAMHVERYDLERDPDTNAPDIEHYSETAHSPEFDVVVRCDCGQRWVELQA